MGFQTKPQLARAMLGRAHARTSHGAGIQAAWVTADEVDGDNPELRGWLEEQAQPYVLAVGCARRFAPAGGRTPVEAKILADEIVGEVGGDRWVRISAGTGAKGDRFYDWVRVELAGSGRDGFGRWLLVRRSLTDGELAYDVCWTGRYLAGTSLAGLVGVAGTR